MRPAAWMIRFTGGLLLAAITSIAVPAQTAGDALPSLAMIDSLLLEGDTAAALKHLGRRLRANRSDAASWNRQGMITWQRTRRQHGRKFLMSKDEVDRLRMADSSLRLAARLAPGNTGYRLDLARFLMSANLVTTRLAAYGEIDDALSSARTGGNPRMLAEALDMKGMLEWRRYESLADRYSLIGVTTPTIDTDVMTTQEIKEYLESFARKLTTFSGETHYRGAVAMFVEAVTADPDNQSARRHLAMALAERKQWEELLHHATVRLERAPWDPDAWFARGLASHRMADYADAAQAFDSALVLLSSAERDRLTRLSRILRAEDTARFVAGDATQRDVMQRLYWMLSDPLWSSEGNERMLEFLARVTYAELRWTSDDFGMRGADTDRGEVHVRYGPPDLIAAFGGNAYGDPTHTVVWRYANGLTFVFSQPPTWGTARFQAPEAAERTIRQVPLAWDNVDAERRIDTIPAMFARFRATSDSADILVLARIPTESLVTAVELSRVPVEVHFHVRDDAFRSVIRDSSRSVIAIDEAAALVQRGWRRRLGAGSYLYRIEALQREAGRAARAVGRSRIGDSTFTLRGFAMSDVVVASRAAPRDGGESASRWDGFAIVPLAGSVRSGESFALLWETYDLAADRQGASRYRVEVSLLKHQRRTGALAMAARIASGVAGATGLAAKGDGQIRFRYERTLAAQPAVVDYFTVALGEAPPGMYTLLVRVTDQVSNRTVAREMPLRVAR